jgi:hypothetical protein
MAEETDHAHLVAYFASVEASHVTGQVVAVGGAQSLYHPLAMKRQVGWAALFTSAGEIDRENRLGYLRAGRGLRPPGAIDRLI